MPLDDTAQTGPDNDTKLDWMRQYQTQKRRCDEENGVLRNILKRAKNGGMNTKSMIATCNAMKLDHSVVQQDMRDTLNYMALRRLPVTADDLFAGMDLDLKEGSLREDDLWQAEEKGYQAGRGKTDIAECPYTSGTQLSVEWLSWHKKGMEAKAKELGPDATQADAARQHPTRKARQTRIPGTETKAPKKLKGRVATKPRGKKNGTGRRAESSPLH